MKKLIITALLASLASLFLTSCASPPPPTTSVPHDERTSTTYSK